MGPKARKLGRDSSCLGLTTAAADPKMVGRTPLVAFFGIGGLGELWNRWRLETFSSFSVVGHVDGGWVHVVIHGQEEHNNDSIICRRFGIGDFFFAFFFCIDAQIFFVLLWVVCGLLVNDIAESVSYNMVVVRRRLGAFIGGVFTGLLSLLGVFPWRLRLHLLLYVGRCSWIPFVGLLFVDPSMPVLRLSSVSGESGMCPGRSTFEQHYVLLMGFKFEDSLSNRESVESFILDLLRGGRWRRSRLRQRRLVTAKSTRCLCNGLMCNFIFFQEYPARGLVVSVLYQ
jgi:hypothetical protein